MAEQKEITKPNFTIRDDTSLEWSGQHQTNANERNAQYLGNKLRSDIVFHVLRDNIKIPAHRLIIGTASPVLESIAYGTGDIAGFIDEVNVRDCSADDFYEVLRFVYTNKVHLTSSNARAILLQAHYYDLLLLESECSAFLLSTLSLTNVCDIFGEMHLLDNALTKECLRMIQNSAHQLFTPQQNIFDLDLKALGQVLELDRLNIFSEVFLFEQLIIWGRAQCDAKKLVHTKINLRNVLMGRINLVRYAAMTLDDFSKCVRLVGPTFFSQAEVCPLFLRIVFGKNHTIIESSEISLTTTPRVLPHQEMILSDTQTDKSTKQRDLFHISCNRTICIVGFGGLPTESFSIGYCEHINQFSNQKTLVKGTRYNQSFLFSAPITIKTNGYFEIKYSQPVKVNYVMLGPFCCNGITLTDKYDSNMSGYRINISRIGEHHQTFNKILFSEEK